MICTIINPSDPYTLETDNFLAAAVGIAIVGNGKLGLGCDETDQSTPILFGWDEWFKEQGIKSLDKWLDKKENKEAVAAALDSVVYGHERDRRVLADALKYIDDPTKREAFRAEQQDKHRSSMNDIATACWETAALLRGKRKDARSGAPIIVAR